MVGWVESFFKRLTVMHFLLLLSQMSKHPSFWVTITSWTELCANTPLNLFWILQYAETSLRPSWFLQNAETPLRPYWVILIAKASLRPLQLLQYARLS